MRTDIHTLVGSIACLLNISRRWEFSKHTHRKVSRTKITPVFTLQGTVCSHGHSVVNIIQTIYSSKTNLTDYGINTRAYIRVHLKYMNLRRCTNVHKICHKSCLCVN